MTHDSILPSQTGRMSPAALALAIGMHVMVAAALWWISPWKPADQAETPIMVTVEPEPLSGGGTPGAASTALAAAESQPPTEPSKEPTQQALAPAEPTPQQPPSTEPVQPSPATAANTEALWQTEASSWKPQVTFEQSLPPPDAAPPPPTSRDMAKPNPHRPPPPRPVQRAQTAVPPRPAQPPSPSPPGDSQATLNLPSPSSASMDSLMGHGGERNDYLSRVFRHIEPFRSYPEAARVNRQRGRVVTRVTINRAGELVALSVDRSSGWPLIDNAELAAIRRAMPFPPPPATMPGDPIVLILPMTYNYEGR